MKILILLLLYLLCSCSSKEDDINEISVNPKVLNHIKPLDYDSYRILYSNIDSSVLINQRRGDYAVKKINLLSGKIKGLVRIGKGHNEYLQLKITDIDNYGDFYCNNYTEALKFSQNGNLIYQQKLGGMQGLRIFYFNKLKDQYIGYGNYSHPKDLLTICDSEWCEIGHIGQFPNDGITESECGPSGHIMAYQGTIMSSDLFSRVAYASKHGDFFVIYDLKDYNSAELIYEQQDNLPKYRHNGGAGVGVTFTSKDYSYVDAYSTNNRIYLLYSGKEIKNASPQGVMSAKYANTIKVYNWDGEHLCNLTTEFNLVSICVSSDDREIVATFHDDNYDIRLCSIDLTKVRI